MESKSEKENCSIAALLPYHSFDPDQRVFVQDDGSLGIVWKLSPPSCEDQDTEGLGAFSSSLAHTIRRVPQGWTLQVLWQSKRDVKEALEKCEEGSRSEGIYGALAQSRSEFIQGLALPDGHGRFTSKTISVHAALLKPGSWSKPGLLALEDPGETLKKSYQIQKTELLDAARNRGFKVMAYDGFSKVFNGLTTVPEVERQVGPAPGLEA